MANKSKSATSSSESKGGTTIVGTPKLSSNDGSPNSSSPSKRYEITKEDILAHLTVDDVKSFMNQMSLGEIESLVEDIPIVKAENVRRTTDLEVTEEYLASQKREYGSVDMNLQDTTTNEEGFRPTYENFLPRYGEAFRASMWKSRYGSLPGEDNNQNNQSLPDDNTDTDTFFNSGTSTTSTTASTTTRHFSNTTGPTTTAFHNSSNASTVQSTMQAQGQTFPSSTGVSTGQPHTHMNQNHFAGVLPTGLALRPTPRPDQYLDYDHDRVVVSRNNRGSNDKERAKIREICTKPISPLLDNSNVKKLLSTDPGSDNVYDIAEDAASWQDGVDSIHQHAVNFDFKPIFLIPSYFEVKNAHSIPINAIFTNSILDHTKVTDDACFQWQEFLRRQGQSEDRTSDHWMEEKLWKSMSPTLLKEVRSDFKRLPQIQQGAVSLVRIIINRMVQDSQDSRRALEEYIKSFSIRNFPGEDVTMACLRLRAVANALGRDRLPADIVQRVLDGFSQASTPAFQHLCHTQVAMMSSSLIRNAIRSDPLYTRLDNIMHDLEVRFMELRSGQNWLGVGHGTNNSSVFAAHHDNGSDSDDDDGTESQYGLYKASLGKKALPFDEWVRDKICRHCGEKGHIQGEHCPTYVRDILAGRIQLPAPKHRAGNRGRPPPHRKPKPTRGLDKSDKSVKRFFQAILDAMSDDDGDDSSPDSAPPKTAVPSPGASSSSTRDHSGFLTALGCPKE